MKQENSRYGDTMVLTIVLWICSLPLVGLVILPLFGRTVAAYTIVGLLILFLLICWGICGWHVVKERSD
jgi:putative effector of murein hydrolase LrgA (UPF0299 family)